jgi:lambda repressor-like predicted transcriptional regulator
MARAYGLSSVMLSKRLNQYGWDLKKALTTPVEDEPDALRIKCVDHLGNKYRSITALSKAYGIPYAALQRRLRHGWDLEKALTKPVKKKPDKYVDHKGVRYSSMTDLAAAYGMSTPTLINRLKKGWDLEKALTAPLKGRKGNNKEDE